MIVLDDEMSIHRDYAMIFDTSIKVNDIVIWYEPAIILNSFLIYLYNILLNTAMIRTIKSALEATSNDPWKSADKAATPNLISDTIKVLSGEKSVP